MKAFFLATTALVLSYSVLAQSVSNHVPAWAELRAQAIQAQKTGNLPVAIACYEKMLQLNPKAQETAIRLGQCYEKLSQFQQALDAFERARMAEPDSYEASHACYLAARVSLKRGDREKAQKYIQMVEELYPDSSYIARTRLLQAEADGVTTVAFNASLQRELAAGKKVDQALKSYHAGELGAARAQLQKVINDFPETAAAIRGIFSLGHIAIREEKTTEALAYFDSLLSRLGGKAPKSRVVRESLLRKAALLHKLGRRDEAQAVYLSLVNPDVPPYYAETAILQSAGIHFELLQIRTLAHRIARNQNTTTTLSPVTSDEWDALRNRLKEAEELCTRKIDKARARLMYLESLYWQRRYRDVPEAVAEFQTAYMDQETTLELLTARHFLGMAYVSLNEWDKAIAELSWVIEQVPNREPWSRGNLIQMSYEFLTFALAMDGQLNRAEKTLSEWQKYFGESMALESIRAFVASQRNDGR